MSILSLNPFFCRYWFRMLQIIHFFFLLAVAAIHLGFSLTFNRIIPFGLGGRGEGKEKGKKISKLKFFVVLFIF